MADDQHPDEPAASPPRRPPRKPGSDEKALTLEVARLFGMSPRALLNREPPPQPPSEGETVADEEDGEANADGG